MGISALAKYTAREVVQTIDDQTLTWRVRVLTTADAARAGVGLDAMAAAIAVANDDDEKKEAAAPSLAGIADLAEWSDRIACQAVSQVKVASADDPGEWEAVRLVFPAMEDTEANPPRMSVAMLSQGTPVMGEVLAIATSVMMGAVETARTFREDQ